MAYLCQEPSIMSKVCQHLASLIVAVVFVSLVNCASTPHKKSVDKVKDVSLVENDIHIMHREQNVIFTH